MRGRKDDSSSLDCGRVAAVLLAARSSDSSPSQPSLIHSSTRAPRHQVAVARYTAPLLTTRYTFLYSHATSPLLLSSVNSHSLRLFAAALAHCGGQTRMRTVVRAAVAAVQRNRASHHTPLATTVTRQALARSIMPVHPTTRPLHTSTVQPVHSTPSALLAGTTGSTATSSPDASNPSSLLKDDYTSIDTSKMKRWTCPQLTLESGQTLRNFPVCYQTYGRLNAAGDNVLVVCHALTGHADLHDWWGSLLGDGVAFDTSRYFVVCANLLGSCYGTAGPTEVNADTGRKWGADFPVTTVRDSVQLHHKLLFDGLGVKRVCGVIGGSLGGMQALEWGFLDPQHVQSIVALACNAKHSAWQIAINHTQRQAIYADPLYLNGRYPPNQPPATGLSIARQFAMITYRTQPVYQTKFDRSVTASPTAAHAAQLSPTFEVERYLLYQGAKLLTRFDANSYIRLTQTLDSHDVGRGRGGEKAALATLRQPALVMGVDSDVLYPVWEQEQLASMIPNSEYHAIKSLEGHDGFLLEQQQIGSAIKSFLERHGQPQSERTENAGSGVRGQQQQQQRAKL